MIKDLIGELARLVENFPAVFGIGVVAEIGTLIHEALAVRIDNQTKGIAVFLKAVADRQITKLRRVAVPGHGVAARPIAPWRGARGQGHLNAVTGIKAGTAHRRQFPAGA